MNLHIYTILAKNSELVQFLFNSILYLDIFVWLGRVLVIILSLQYSKKKKKSKRLDTEFQTVNPAMFETLMSLQNHPGTTAV